MFSLTTYKRKDLATPTVRFFRRHRLPQRNFAAVWESLRMKEVVRSRHPNSNHHHSTKFLKIMQSMANKEKKD